MGSLRAAISGIHEKGRSLVCGAMNPEGVKRIEGAGKAFPLILVAAINEKTMDLLTSSDLKSSESWVLSCSG
jgi:hypothetical protein